MLDTQNEQSLLEASLESARSFNSIVAECSATSGLLTALTEFSSLAQIVTRMGVHPAKEHTLRAVLNVLVDTGFVERRSFGSQVVYRARREKIRQAKELHGSLRRYTPRAEVLAPWFGDNHIDRVRAYNRKLLGEDLGFLRQPTVKMGFNETYITAWRFNLLHPLYEFGRALAVRELVQRGRRFLNLGCGPGFGVERLAQFSPNGCEIVAVDKSRDFLELAKKIIYPGAKVRFVERDLNTGLPPLPQEYFDGILFNGAFHFIENKAALLREMNRVLRLGGLLVIGHCFVRSSFSDESMVDFYFSLLENDHWIVTWDELLGVVTDAGFVEVRRYHRGSHSYLLAVKERPCQDVVPASRGPLMVGLQNDR